MGAVNTSLGRIGITVTGDGSATPIVFLHGVGSDKTVWSRQLDYFGATRRSAAFDYPGYGESDFIADASRDDFAAAIFAGMDAIGMTQAHVCGLSLGGVIAIAMHHAAPERIASLILADTFAVHPEGQEIYDRATAATSSMTMRELAEARASMLLGSAATPAMLTEVVDTMARIDPRAYRLGAQAVWLADQRDRLDTIRVPTLVIVGDEDRITPPSLSDELAKAIADAGCISISRSGHLANLEQPEAFNAAIDRFLSEIERKN